VRRERHVRTHLRQPRMRQEPHRLVFLDETSTTTKMTRLRGRAPRGGRLLADAPFGHWGSQTFVAGLRCNELIAPWVIDGAMNSAIFDTYIETQLAPSLAPGDIVILDNLSPPQIQSISSPSEGARKLAAVPAAILPGPQPDRDGVRQAQGTLAPPQGPKPGRPLARRRKHLRSLRTNRMLELLQGRRICPRLNARNSRACLHSRDSQIG
jgi:hypothetical protein